MKTILLLCLFIFHLIPAHLQAKSNYQFKELNIADGLTNSKVNDICIDYKGHVWIATPYGLNCYDQDRIRTYLREETDSLSLPCNNIIFVEEDCQRNLWIGTPKGLCIYNRKNSKFRKVTFEQQPLTVFSMLSDSLGIYFGEKGKLYHYDFHHKRLSKVSLSTDKPVYSYFYQIVRYNDHQLLLNTRWHGIYLFDITTSQLSRIHYITEGNTPYVFVDSNQRIWVSHYGQGLFCYEHGQLKRHFNTSNSPLTYNVIHSLEQKDGELWIGTDGGGINILSLESLKFMPPLTQEEAQNSFPTHAIHCLYRDPMNNMWAGSVRSGVIYIYETYTRTFGDSAPNSKYSLSNRSINCIAEGRNGDIWMGTDGGGINRYIAPHNTFEHYSATRNEKVTSIVELNGNELLVSFFNKGLYVFNHRTQALKPFDGYDLNRRMGYEGSPLYVERLDSHQMVFSRDHVCIYDLDKQKRQTIASRYKDYERSSPLIRVRRQQEVYIIDLHKILMYDTRHGLLTEVYTGGEVINDACVDEEDNIWMATATGVVVYNTRTRQKSRIKPDIIKEVRAVKHDGQGHLWIGTAANRLFVYSTDSQQALLLSEADGFIRNEYTVNGMLVAQSGYAYIGGTMGMTAVSPSLLKKGRTDGRVRLVDVRVNGKVYGEKDYEKGLDVTLPHNYTAVLLKLGMDDGNLFRRHAFRYTVAHNGRTDEVYTFKPTFATRYLPEGRHTVAVSYITPKGEWSAPQTLARIRVLPPWWKSPWFVALCLAVVLLWCIVMMWYIHRRDERRKSQAVADTEQRLAEETIQFLINMGREFKTPLTMIVSPLKDLLESGGLTADMGNRLKNIYRQTLHIKGLVDLFMEVEKVKEGEPALQVCPYPLNVWLRECVEASASGLRGKGIDVVYALEERIGSVVFDRDKCSFIVRCFIMNAVRMCGECSTLTVGSRFADRNTIRITVGTDCTPMGNIDMSNLFSLYRQSISGSSEESIRLSYSKSLIDLHKGRIGVDQTAGSRLVFYFELPTDSRLDSRSGAPATVYPDKAPDFSRYGNCSILVISESRDFRNYLKVSLHNEFRHVYVAQHGRDGLALVKSIIPDVIISDLVMAHMDGFKLCQAVKEDQHTRYIPFILLTSYSTPVNMSTAYRLGADMLLPKPFNMETLLYVINNLLDNRKRFSRTEAARGGNAGTEHAITSNADEKFMEDLDRIIEDNIENVDLDVKFLTGKMGISRTSLFSRLKSIKETGIADYINSLRIRRASMLLRTTRMSMTEIAEKVGFSSPKYFSRVFKHFTGMTPTEFRNAKDKE